MKNHRSGKKIGGGHTTVTDLAAELTDMAVKLPEVSRVSPGIIKTGPDMAGGQRRVKLMNLPGYLLLKVRQGRSMQEVRVYTKDGQTTMVALARLARNAGVSICFEKHNN